MNVDTRAESSSLRREAPAEGEPSPPASFVITPHPGAPILSNPDEGALIIDQLLAETDSDNFQTTQTVRFLLREASLVSMWFFLRVVAGFAGPFERLNKTLHLDMCNTYQLYGLPPASHLAAFLPRGFYKSTIFTTGSAAWDLLRDPEECIGLCNAIDERAKKFMYTVQRIFDANELFGWLFPTYVPPKNAPRWNNNEMALPNRRRHYNEASLTPVPVKSSTEGYHFTRMIFDDIIGMRGLNSNQQANADMFSTTNWFLNSQKSLLRDWHTSRLTYVGTRYATHDTHAEVVKKCRRVVGWQDETVKPARSEEDRIWTIYYRLPVEDGEITFPEAISKKGLAEMDEWTRATQMENNPAAAGLSELNQYEVKHCSLDWDDQEGYVIAVTGEPDQPLRNCDLIQSGDPASTDSYISSRVSRTAVLVWAMDPQARVFLLHINVGRVTIAQMFEWFFSNRKKFGPILRGTILEAHGPYKMLVPELRRWEKERNTFLSLKDISASGDKDARIRTVLQPYLEEGRIYAAEHCRQSFVEELTMFPNTHLKDILDASAMAIRSLYRPQTEREVEMNEEANWRFELERSAVTGY